MHNDIGGGGEGNRGCDHLIAGADPGGGKGEMQPGRARVEADCVFAADPFGKLLLELLCPLSRGEPAGAKRFEDLLLLLLADPGLVQRSVCFRAGLWIMI